MRWFRDAVLRKYAVFRGRARREEYWYYLLYFVIGYGAVLLLDVATGTFDFESQRGWLGRLYLVVLALPTLAVSVRRLHDTGRSGWWLPVGVVPVIGQILVLFFLVQDGDAGHNRCGPDPKGRQLAAAGPSPQDPQTR
jgi:uncharacterized membrane protein YhaH (DUF805 family)